MRSSVALLLLTGAMCLAQKQEVFHGRKAFVLQNDLIRVSTLRGGGSIAEVRFRSGSPQRQINPLRVPHYQTIEPYEYDPARHDALYGKDSHRWLSAGYMGHFVCFPIFGGPSSPQEVANGLGNHGEAPIVEWKLVQGSDTSIRFGAELPKTEYRIERTMAIKPGESVVRVEEWVENAASFDRPINWVQHVTFGPPFIAPGKSMLDLSGTKGQVAGGSPKTSSLTPNSELTWPEGIGPDGKKVSLRPFQPTPHAGTYFAVLMDQKNSVSYFTMYNPDYPVLIGYVFRTAESPWIGDFQENLRMTTKPWDGKTVTRGIEFGTTPFAEGLRQSVIRGTMLGVPTFRWIAGKERLKTSYAIFIADIPKDFSGVGNISIENSAILVSERGSSRKISLPASELKAFLNDAKISPGISTPARR
jgi:hypothetical protein